MKRTLSLLLALVLSLVAAFFFARNLTVKEPKSREHKFTSLEVKSSGQIKPNIQPSTINIGLSASFGPPPSEMSPEEN